MPADQSRGERLVTADSTLKIRPQVLLCEVDDEAVVLDPESGQYFGLDEIGSRVWSLLQSEGRLGKIEELLLREYEVPADRLHRDLAALIAELVRHGLVEIDESGPE